MHTSYESATRPTQDVQERLGLVVVLSCEHATGNMSTFVPSNGSCVSLGPLPCGQTEVSGENKERFDGGILSYIYPLKGPNILGSLHFDLYLVCKQ